MLVIDRDEFNFNIPVTDSFAHHPELALLRDRKRELGLKLPMCAAAAGGERGDAITLRTRNGIEQGGRQVRCRGRPVGLINEGLVDVLGFTDVAALDHYWRTGKMD